MPPSAAQPSDDPRKQSFTDELTACLPALRRRALKLCLNRVEAEDLVHDTVERALKFQQSFQSGTNLQAWSQQVLFSVFVSRCRKRGRERRALEILTFDPNAWTHTASEQVCEKLPPGLSQVLDELPEKFRTVVDLVDLKELSYREAAETLKVPVGTVMSRLFRGRKQLAYRLGQIPTPCQATAQAA